MVPIVGVILLVIMVGVNVSPGVSLAIAGRKGAMPAGHSAEGRAY